MKEQMPSGGMLDGFANFLALFVPDKKDPKDKRDLQFRDLDANRCEFGKIPLKVDYSQWMSWPIQQGRLGSCVGCAGTNIMQYWENAIKENTQSNLSEQWLYHKCEEIDQHPGQGTFPRCAMQVLKNQGIPIDSAWPYSPVFPAESVPQPWAAENAAKRKINSYYRVTTLKQLLKAIAEVGPVLASVRIFSDWYDKSPPVFEVPKKVVHSLGLHAIGLCGYDLAKERIHFINSWGWNWGDGGQGWITFDYIKKYKQDLWVPVPNGALV